MILLGLLAAQLLGVDGEKLPPIAEEFILKSGCDVQESDPSNKASESDAFPWIVQINNRMDPNLVRRCTGSLISHHHILTTAWCLYTEPEEDGPFLDIYLTNRGDIPRAKVCNAYIHPNFRVNTDFLGRVVEIVNNIGILTLKEPWKGTFMPPPCPQQYLCLVAGYSGAMLNSSQSYTTISWGFLRNLGSANPRLEKPLSMPSKVIRASQCTSAAHPEYFCSLTIGSENGHCYGDDGAPVVYPYMSRYLQVGIVSWIFGAGHCSELNHRTINVTYHAMYIRDVLNHNDTKCGERHFVISNQTYPRMNRISIH